MYAHINTSWYIQCTLRIKTVYIQNARRDQTVKNTNQREALIAC